MNFLKLVSLFFILTSYINKVYSQEAPHYQLPKDRNAASGKLGLPNLKTSIDKLFISVYGGVKFQNIEIQTNPSQQLQDNSFVNLPWGIGLGYNSKNKWEFEGALYKQNFSARTTYQSKAFPEVYEVFSNNVEVNSVLMTFKNRVFYIDRVSKAAQLNMGLGLLVLPEFFKGRISTSKSNYILRNRNALRDTLTLEHRFIRTKNPLGFQFGFDIEGRIIEKLEIGVYFSGVFYPKNVLRSQIDTYINSNFESTGLSELSKFQYNFGIKTKYNFSILYKYKSKLP